MTSRRGTGYRLHAYAVSNTLSVPLFGSFDENSEAQQSLSKAMNDLDVEKSDVDTTSGVMVVSSCSETLKRGESCVRPVPVVARSENMCL